MDTFSREVREDVAIAQNYYCATPGCTNRIDDFHHCLPNAKIFRKLFPLFIQSIFNCVGLCRDCHQSRKRFQFKISDKFAALYEKHLSMLKGEKQ